MNKINYDARLTECWRWFPHTFAQKASRGKWLPYDFIVYISKFIYPKLLAGNARIIVTIPPRHGKSEFISHWLPTWYLDLFPYKRIGLASYSASFAKKWGKKVKEEFTHNEFINNKLLEDTRAGNFFKIKCNLSNHDHGSMMTTGVDGPFTGEGFDCIIIDDPIKNWKEASSEIRRQSLKDWFSTVAETRLEPNASIIILLTRWHEDDLAGYLLEKHHDEWDLINMPALAEQNDVLGRIEGQALCPQRYTREQLIKRKVRIGSRFFNALFQQRPSSAEGDVWKRQWWRYYDYLPEKFNEIIQSWDLRLGDKKNAGSFVVGQVWGKINNDYYLLDQVRDRWSFEESKKEVIKLKAKWPKCNRILIENKANGPAMENSLKSTISGILLIEPEGGKFVRAAACEGVIQSGHVYLPKYAYWLDDFLDETASFNAAGSHKNDDQVDAASQAINYFEKASNSYLLKLIKK